MSRRRSTFVSLPKMPEVAPIDIRLITALLVLGSILFGIGVVLVFALWANTLVPPPFPPTQLETL